MNNFIKFDILKNEKYIVEKNRIKNRFFRLNLVDKFTFFYKVQQ